MKRCSRGSAAGPVFNMDDWNHEESEQNSQPVVEIQQLLLFLFFFSEMQFGSSQGNLNIFYLLVLPIPLPFSDHPHSSNLVFPIASLCLFYHSSFPALQQPSCYIQL